MRITLTEVSRENGVVQFRVACEPRPPLGWERTCNGITLRSVASPEWYPYRNTLFLWGDDPSGDCDVLSATEAEYERICKAVAESNALDEDPHRQEDRIAELEKRVAALEANVYADPVQDDAGGGDPQVPIEASLEHVNAENDRLEGENIDLRQQLAAMHDERRGNYWAWSDVDDNHPESMANDLVVLIRGRQLRELLKGNTDGINVGATPVDLSLPEPEPKADEAEPKRFFANLYTNGFVSMHQSLQSANYNRAAGFDKCLELVEAAAYDRLKAENARLKSQRDEMVEEADIAIRSLAIAQIEQDELQKQLAQSAIEYSGLVGELTAVAAERDRLKSQMLRFSEGKNISNPVWYAKNCLLADADLKQQLATPVDLSPPDSHEPKRWFVNLYAVAYDRLKAERDVLREFAEAVAEGKVDEWNKRHEVKGLSWYASAKGCLLAADAAKQGK